MKKLTAGIFSVLMGLVSVNAAEAAVASKGYVDTKVGLNTEAIAAINNADTGILANAKDYTDTKVQEATEDIKASQDTISGQVAQHDQAIGALDGRVTELEEVDNFTQAEFTAFDATNTTAIGTAKSEAISAAAADAASKVSALETGAVAQNAQAISDMDAAYKAADSALDGRVTANTNAISDMDAAYKAADSALDTRVTANTNAITGLQTSKADKGTKLSDYGITDAYTRSETDTKIADAVKGTMEGDVSTILGDYLKKTEAETIYESIAAAKATNDAQDIKITANTDALTVLNGNASVEGSVAKSIFDALAPYSTTTQVQGLINSATTDMATNSSVNTALSNYTNTTDLTALLNGKQDNLSGSDAVKIDNNVVSIIADSITGAMIKDLTIDTADIKDGAVTSAKLAGGSVTAEKLGTGAVGDNAVSALSQSKITGLEDALSAKFVAPAYEAVTDNGTYVLTATKEGDEIKYAWEDITRN